MEKRKKVILLTDTFPYGAGETFLENEIPFLVDEYDLIIISSNTKDMQSRNCPEHTKVYRTYEKDGGHSFIRLISLLFQFFFSKLCINEVLEILREKKFIRARLKSSLYFYIMAKDVQTQIKKYRIDYYDANTIIYSYWSNHKLFAFLDERKKIQGKIITRLHGYDLYNERYTETKRQPFKRQMDRLMDAVVLVSKAGMDYYINHFLVNRPEKVLLCRLGTSRPASLPVKKNDNFVLCSCSNVIRIKHIEKIVEALKTINDISIKWIHFGDGTEMENIQQLSSNFPPNISVVFMGKIENTELMQYYCDHYIDCFITTSETEGGCPVSIQEALSFGMPVIATNVGGIPEMIRETENILLSAKPSPNEVAKAIRMMFSLDEKKILQIRRQNMAMWEENYNKEKNYKKIVKILNQL